MTADTRPQPAPIEITALRLAELRKVAEATTQGDLSTAETHKADGLYDCPACNGEGYVDGETFTNFDGIAIGVQFFGVGQGFKAYEAFFRAASPPTVLALLSKIASLEAERDEAREGESRWLIRMADVREASGIGVKPMLSEVPAALAALKAGAEASEAREQSLQARVAEAIEALTEAERFLDYFANGHTEFIGSGTPRMAWEQVRATLARLTEQGK